MMIGFARDSRGFFTFFSVVLFCLIAALYLFLDRFMPIYKEKAVYLAENKANIILNNAICSAFSDINSEGFTNIEEGADKTVMSVNTNTSEISAIKTKIYRELLKNAENEQNATLYIPIGSLSSYPLLQNIGFSLPIKIYFDTTMDISFSSEVKEVGINNVYYEIYINATAGMHIVSVGLRENASVSAQIPVSQMLIAGKVPDAYGYDNNRR